MAARSLVLSANRPAPLAFLLCTIALLAAASPVEADEAPADLQGVLPDYIPNGLTEGDFNQLGDNWTEWATTTGRLVADFYTSDDDNVRGRRATLNQLKLKLATMRQALGNPQYLSIYGTLADLYGRLSRRVAVSEALLNALQQNESAAAQLRPLAAELLEAMEDYESEPTTENMEAIRNTFDDLRRISPDGGAALSDAMRRNYLNFNLRAVMDESLIQDIIRDTRMESGYINEMLAGAQVTGCQWTDTTVNVDLKPSDSGVSLDLLLNGTIRSSAQGETHSATVYTTGRHCFTARKRVYFDGEHFQHWCASVNVGGGSCPYAAQTCLSWAPLLGGAMEKFAIKVANDKAPQTNAYTYNKIRGEVSSQFNRETGKMLNEAELSLEEKLAGPLREEGYFPDVREFRSTETELQMRTRTMEAGELGGSDVLPLPVYPTHGVLVQVHESLFNQLGNRLELDGKRFTPDTLQDYLRKKLEAIVGKAVDLSDLTAGPTEPDPNSPKVEEIVFNDADAARFQIRGGAVVLILSMGLKLEGREEIPPQRISVPLKFSLNGDRIVMERGTVGVSPIGPVAPRDRAQLIVRAGIMRSKIEEAFEPREFDSTFTANAGQKQITLKVTDLRARSGWLSAIATDGVGKVSEPAPQPMQQAAEQQEILTW